MSTSISVETRSRECNLSPDIDIRYVIKFANAVEERDVRIAARKSFIQTTYLIYVQEFGRLRFPSITLFCC